MISFEHWNDGYKIKLSGIRKNFFAADVQAIHLAVDHYYMCGTHAGGKKPNGCPLCKKGSAK